MQFLMLLLYCYIIVLIKSFKQINYRYFTFLHFNSSPSKNSKRDLLFLYILLLKICSSRFPIWRKNEKSSNMMYNAYNQYRVSSLVAGGKDSAVK